MPLTVVGTIHCHRRGSFWQRHDQDTWRLLHNSIALAGLLVEHAIAADEAFAPETRASGYPTKFLCRIRQNFDQLIRDPKPRSPDLETPFDVRVANMSFASGFPVH